MQNTGMEGSSPGATSTGRYGEDVAEKTHPGLGRLTDSAQQTLQRVTQAASQAASRLGERAGEFSALQGRAVETTRTYMREHPVATIAIAVGVGLLLSRLLNRR